jgi:DNA-binding transcriptional MerR regulator
MNRKLSTTVEVAAAAEVPRATLQYWIKTGQISAPAVQLVDGKAVRFWTEAQKREIRKMKGTLKPGPKNGTHRRPRKAKP